MGIDVTLDHRQYSLHSWSTRLPLDLEVEDRHRKHLDREIQQVADQLLSGQRSIPRSLGILTDVKNAIKVTHRGLEV